MQKRTGSKGRRVVAAACAVAMALAVAVTPAHAAPAKRAAPVSTQGVAHVNGSIGWVPTYRYIFEYYNGVVKTTYAEEKEISVPAGYRIGNTDWEFVEAVKNPAPGVRVKRTERYVYDIVKI